MNRSREHKRAPFLTRKDLAILFSLITVIALFGVTVKFVLQKDTYVTVELLAWGGDWWWNVSPPYYWNTKDVVVGAKAYNSLRKVDVEVLDVVKIEESNHTYMWMKAKLLVKKNVLTHSYTFHQSVLQVGSTINIAPDNIALAGNIVGIEGGIGPPNQQSVVITAKINSGEEYKYNTKQYYRQQDADAIVVGDVLKDSKGDAQAEILEKSVIPAEIVTTNTNGEPLLRQSPLYKDITLKIRLRVIQSGQNYFYNFYQPIRPGETLNLQFANITLTPKIISVSPEAGGK